MQRPGASSVSRRAIFAAVLSAAVVASALATTAPVAVAGVEPQTATVKISPTKGPPNTTIDVELTITPADVCGDHSLAVAVRTPDGDVVDNDSFKASTSGVSHSTLLVPDLPAGTILDVYGGCNNAQLVSPIQHFQVTESTSSPPTVTLNPTSVAAGSKVKITAKFSEPCNAANAVLINPYTGWPIGLSAFFTSTADGNGTSTITVPANAWAGPGYTVKVACLDPPSPSSSATFTVTGNTPQAAIQISPTEGPPGTVIDVALSITPIGACPVQVGHPNVGFLLRTQEQIDTGAIAADFDVVESDEAPVHDTLHVSSDFPAGTILYVSAGCIVPDLMSPFQQFIVTGADSSSAPSFSSWKKKLKLNFETGLQSVFLLLIAGPQFTAPTTTTTSARTAPTSAATTLPPPPPPPSSEATTSTTEESTTTSTTFGGKP